MHSALQVVINTLNRSDTLVLRSVKSALDQNPRVDKVILIDQNLHSLKLPTALLSDSRLIHLAVKARSVSQARNEMLKMKLSGWIIFCDDDGCLAPGYVEELWDLVDKHPEVKIFAGSIVRDDNGEFYSKRHQIGGDLNRFRFTKLLMGSNFCVQAEVFCKLNGFDERFGAGAFWGSGEETDFAWKALFSKEKMLFAKQLRVLHVPPYHTDFRKSCQKAFSYGRGKGALVGKWLFEKKQVGVSYELIEMICLPWLQSAWYLMSLKGKRAVYPLFSVLGRVGGLCEFICRNVSSALFGSR